MPDLKGKVAIVTGASRGIGRGVAIGLADAGATVVITSRTATDSDAPRLADGDQVLPGSLADTVAEVKARGGEVISIPADLSNIENIKSLVDETLSKSGRVDIVANCAMGFPQDYEGMAFWESPVSDWDVQNLVGIRSHYLLAYFAVPSMVERGDGLIVNVSTAGAICEYYNIGFRVAHGANTRLAKAMAFDLRDKGVTSVALWPRWVLTERVKMAAESRHPGFTVSPEELTDADTPELVGAAIARMSTDPDRLKKSGHIQLIAELAQEYGLTEADGKMPRIDPFTHELRERIDKIETALDW